MLNQEREEIFQFLAGNWYSRPENDLEIVKEVVDNIRPDKLRQEIDLLRHYLAGAQATASKAAFIRKSVQRYIADDDDAAIDWLNEVIRLLEQSLARKS